MAEQPGVVTIMHVDVEGSTALTTRVGDEAAGAVLAETKRVVREQAEARGGVLVDAVGDAMMLTFGSPRTAISAAVAVQDALTERERERPGESLRVRVGLNVGEVVDRDGVPFGAAVNAGARVMAKANGGEILVSELVRRLAGTVPGVEYRDRGRHAFKGFDEPWRLYQLMWPGAPPPRPKQRRRPSRRTLVAAAALVVALGATAVAVALATRASNEIRALEPNTVGLVDPQSGRILDRIEVGDRPTALAVAAGTLWVANKDGKSVTRVDERTGRTATIVLDGHPTAIAADRRGAWVEEAPERKLVRIERRFDHATITRPHDATPLLEAGGALWSTARGAILERRDVRTGALRRTWTPDSGANDIASGGGTIWALGGPAVTPIEARSGLVRSSVRLVGAGQAIAASRRSVWVTVRRFADGSWVVQEIDAESLTPLAASAIPANPVAIVAVGDAAWVAAANGTLTSVADGRTVSLGATPTALVRGRRGLWVAVA